METEQRALAGWGRTSPSVATLVRATSDELAAPGVLDRLTEHGRGAIARGLGRSYGDPAQNGGGTVIELQPGHDPIRLERDPVTGDGLVSVHAATSLDVLLRDAIQVRLLGEHSLHGVRARRLGKRLRILQEHVGDAGHEGLARLR